MKWATGDLGKIQWNAVTGLSSIENLPPEVALLRARDLFAAILKRVESLNDSYSPRNRVGIEGVGRDEALVVDFDARQVRDVDILGKPLAVSPAINDDDNAKQELGPIKSEEGVRLNKNLIATPDGADVVPFFERRLDRIFGRR